MSMSDFARLLQNEIPRLRRYARALTRDAARADDLVQSCLVRAIAKEHLWEPGTRFARLALHDLAQSECKRYPPLGARRRGGGGAGRRPGADRGAKSRRLLASARPRTGDDATAGRAAASHPAPR